VAWQVPAGRGGGMPDRNTPSLFFLSLPPTDGAGAEGGRGGRARAGKGCGELLALGGAACHGHAVRGAELHLKRGLGVTV